MCYYASHQHCRKIQDMKNKTQQIRHAGPWLSAQIFGMPYIPVLIIACLLGGPTPILPSAWAQTFSDDTFNNTDWDILAEIFVNNDERGGGNVGALQVEEGGNPGTFRQVQQALTSADDSATILAFHRNANAVYTPSTQRAISTIGFSIDAITFSEGSPLAVGPALMQNGGIYFSAGTNTDRKWNTVSFSDLTVESFFNLDFFSPNFSKTGSAITFGFAVSSSGFADLTDVEFSGGVDNWSVTITPESALPPPQAEPEPAPKITWDVTGVDLDRVICTNKTNGQKMRIDEDVPASGSCGDLGLTWNPGDNLQVKVVGKVNSVTDAGGAVTGIDATLLVCKNKSTDPQEKVRVDNPPSSWNWNDASLALALGDRVQWKAKGLANESF